MAENLISFSGGGSFCSAKKKGQRLAFKTGSKTGWSGNLTVDLIRDSTPQGMNGEFSIVSSVKNGALEIVSEG
jgi:hypothetical protein